MPYRSSKRIRAIVVVVVAVLGVAAVLGDECGGSGYSSSGCSRYEDHTPMTGGCRPRAGDTCYQCEYNCHNGIFSSCGESIDGSVQYCEGTTPLNPV